MPEKGIINTKQFIWMLFIIITSVTTMQIPAILITLAGKDAWLSVIGGWLLDVLLAIIYAYMGIRFPGENFVQYSITILGKYLGRIVGLSFPLFFLLLGTILLRGLSQLVNSVFLPNTPLEVILISGLFVSAYISRKGVEVIARITEVLGPLFFVSGIATCLLVLPSVEISRLEPQLDAGVVPFIVASPFMLVFFGICIMMAMFIPICNRPENGLLAKFSAVSMGALLVGLLVTVSAGVFGCKVAGNMYSPGLSMARMVHFGQYLERIELIWMVILVGAGIVVTALMLWAFGLGIAQITGLKTYQPLVYPGALLSLVLGVVSFHSNVQQGYFVRFSFPLIAAYVESGLELLLFAAALILRKRGTP